MSKDKQTFFYKDKPLFGLDIGHGSIKVMQLGGTKKGASITGYGTATFDYRALDNGVITDPAIIAKAMHSLFDQHLIGQITTRRVAIAIPTYRTFSRSMRLPKLNASELHNAVQLEVEQYVPVPLQDLYLDYATSRITADISETFVVAVPKNIVDSYLALAKMLDLEAVLIEPTMASCARLFTKDKQSDITSIIIDFGSLTADISIVDKTILTTSTVPAGGLVFTEAIRDKLNISIDEAGDIKTKFGLDVSIVQKDVLKALEPALAKLVTEIRRVMRYYEEHYGPNKQIGQIVMLGGGANIPGLGTWLTDTLKIPVRTHNHPWAVFDHADLKLPLTADRLMYVTVAGLALVPSKEVYS